VKAGAVAVGIGSDLTAEAVKTGDYTHITRKSAQYVEAFKVAKNK
jgi:2-dehydro-3-deoxyphosphogluconate aldolase/(4S)-4-hydroxy-2-oxoglutarate aldolase